VITIKFTGRKTLANKHWWWHEHLSLTGRLGDEEVLDVIRLRIAENGLRPTAREMGFSAPFVSDVVNGRRNLSEAVAASVGLTIVPPPPPPPRIWQFAIPIKARQPGGGK
jgi:hypothetical protein